MNDLVTTLSRRLDERQLRLHTLDRYAAGEQPLAYLADASREAMGGGFNRLAVNIPRVLVNTLAERLRVTGFDGIDVAKTWARLDLDQIAGVVHREALTLGTGYVLVWADGHGRPTATAESAHQVAVLRDPATREVTAAGKRWVADGRAWMTVFTADEVRVHVSKANVADPAALPATGWDVHEAHPNGLGVVPMVPFVNAQRLSDLDGAACFEDALPLVDALNKVLADLLVGSEHYSRPRRFATGIELVEDEAGEVLTPLDLEAERFLTAESPDAKFGQLPAADLASYSSAVEVLTAQIRTVTGLPESALGVRSNQPPSADALRAAEAGLVARAEGLQQGLGRSWEAVARLLHAVETGTDPQAHRPRVRWADASTRSEAAAADAVVKLHQAGLLPADYALARLGYSADEISEIRAARRTEALDQVILEPTQ